MKIKLLKWPLGLAKKIRKIIESGIPISFIAGISAIIIFWGFTLISMIFFPGKFNPTENWMSNLGNSNFNPKGAIFFNIGCIITGIALFPFYLGFFELRIGGSRNKRLTILTQITGFFSAFSIIMIGVFPEDNFEIHAFWAAVLFFLTIPTLLLPSIALYKYDFTKTIAKYGFIATSINVLLWVFFVPIFEWLTIIFAFGFIGLIIEMMNRRIEKFRFIRQNMKSTSKK